jgi:hypothetical protein
LVSRRCFATPERRIACKPAEGEGCHYASAQRDNFTILSLRIDDEIPLQQVFLVLVASSTFRSANGSNSRTNSPCYMFFTRSKHTRNIEEIKITASQQAHIRTGGTA